MKLQVCNRKGIILAGGTGSRLRPATSVVNKHLLPIYDKPMIYYPLSTLLLAGVRDFLLISTPEDLQLFERLFGDGSHLGISIQYQVQTQPRGVAEAFLLAEDFIADCPVAVHLGDNVFYGQGFYGTLTRVARCEHGAHIFAYRVHNPRNFGVVELSVEGDVVSLEEKPRHPKSNLAVVGLYFYDSQAVEIARTLKLSPRGELEITDINREYLRRGQLKCERLGRGFAWLDTGSHQSLIQAANFVETVESRQGLKLACIEEICCIKGHITPSALAKLGKEMGNDYGKYLIVRSEELAAGGT